MSRTKPRGRVPAALVVSAFGRSKDDRKCTLTGSWRAAGPSPVRLGR